MLFWGDFKKDNEKFALFAAFLIPSFYFLIFSLNNWIFGVDARYLNLFYNYHSAWVSNAYASLVWIAVLLSFANVGIMVGCRKQSPLFMGSLFLLNLFNIRLLMPDADNWIFLLGGILIVRYFKDNPYKIKGLNINHTFMGLLSILIYFIYRGFMMVNSAGNATDMLPNYAVFLMFIPTYYILFRKKDYNIMVFLFIMTLIFMTGKMVAVAMPIFIYSLYLDFMDMKYDFRHDRIIRIIIIFSLMAYMFVPFIELSNPMVHYALV